MATLIGKYRVQYEFDHQQVKVTYTDGRVIYIPFDDMVMVVAAYKRRLIMTTSSAKLLGLEE